MPHVFIVSEKTLKVHLEYGFSGTGVGEKDTSSIEKYKCDFLLDNNIEINHNREALLVSMLADVSRIRKGDKILFYLQKSRNYEGKFFGSFKVKDEPFIENNDYLLEELEKNLTFRLKIEPDKVYAKGVSERNCLDSLEGITYPYEMCWSLIYRKLSANRGCTMITDYEYQKIMEKIAKENDDQELIGPFFTYNHSTNEIEMTADFSKYNNKNQNKIDIFPRLKYQDTIKHSLEIHLQAYILQHLEKIEPLKVIDAPITWIGNEVHCGVGGQSIDIVFIQENKEELHYIVCELKNVQPDIPSITKQLKKYVEWLDDYILPTSKNKKIYLHPVIVAPIPTNNTINKIKETSLNFYIPAKQTERMICETKYISFEVLEDRVAFKDEKISAGE